VIFSTGYSLPSSDEPLTHARIAHANNWLSGGTVTASGTATDYFADGPTNSLTYEKWSPDALTATWEYDHGSAAECDYCCIGAHTMGTSGNTLQIQYEGASRTNIVTYSEDFTDASWSKVTSGVALDQDGPDGVGNSAATLSDDSSGGTGIVQCRLTPTVSTATQYTFSAFLKAGSLSWASIRFGGFTTPADGGVWFDLSAGAVGTATAGLTGAIQDFGDGWYRCSVTFTTDAADTSGNLSIELASADGVRMVNLDGTSSILIFGAQLEVGGSATSYIPTSGSTAASTWYDLIPWTQLTTDMPVFAIFEPVTAQAWRIRLTNGTVPEIGVVKFGKALQMQRALYGGHTPLDYARQTIMRSNRSVTGEFLGRTKLRNTLATSYDWAHLKRDWLDANWKDFQLAIEEEPFFLAWRPGDFSEVGLCYTDQMPVPSSMGIRDLFQVSLNVSARGYE